jgi:hypothetical protein
MTSTSPRIDNEINQTDFLRIISEIADQDEKDFYCQKYKKDRLNNLYRLDESATDDDKWRLWGIYIKADGQLINYWLYKEKAAYYFWVYRQKIGRIADSVDDVGKAEYMIYLIKYLTDKLSSLVPLNEGDDKMNELIVTIYHIYDRAYFNKKAHSVCSDLECFAEAERYYCLEKAFDYLAYLNYMNRKDNNLAGNEYSDYIAAIQKYDEWKRSYYNPLH